MLYKPPHLLGCHRRHAIVVAGLIICYLFAVVRQFLTVDSYIGGVQTDTTSGLLSWKDTNDKNIWYTNYALAVGTLGSGNPFTMAQSTGKWSSAADAAKAYICQAPAT